LLLCRRPAKRLPSALKQSSWHLLQRLLRAGRFRQLCGSDRGMP